MERSATLLTGNGRFGMIVPAGVLGLDDAISLRSVLLKRYDTHHCSTYSIRPSKLFEGVDQRLCIYLAHGQESKSNTIWTTKYHHWNADERDNLLANISYERSFFHDRLGRIPQIGDARALGVLRALERSDFKTISSYYTVRQRGSLLHYHRSPRYWIRAMNFEQYFKSATRSRSIHHFRDLWINEEQVAKIIGSLLNSSLFFYWFVSVGNGRNITGNDVEQMPAGDLADPMLSGIPDVFDRLMDDYRANSFVRIRQDAEFQEFRPSKSKPVIDEIDRVLARHYGFTGEELDFIINYDIKYRMGREAAEDD